MEILQAEEILENEEVKNVGSFKEASDLCDSHYSEWKNKSTGKVDCQFDECELDIGTLYLFYPPQRVVTYDYLYVLVEKNMKDLINWQEVSRRITGEGQNIRKNKVPKKYQWKVDGLMRVLRSWERWMK